MITDILARLGIPAWFAKAAVALLLIAAGGIVTAVTTGQPAGPAVVGLLVGLAYLVDPNAGHAGPGASGGGQVP